MRSSLRLPVFATLLAGACACVTPGSRQSIPAGAVVLRFAWPQTLSARVTQTLLLSHTTGERIYWWTLQPGPEKGQRRLAVHEAAGPPLPIFADLADPEYTTVFDAEGAFVSHEDPEDSAVLSLLKAMPLEDARRAELRRQIESTQKEVAQSRWEHRVGHWRDVMLLPGEVVRFKTRLWVGHSPRAREEVEAEERTTVETAVACSPEVPDTHCVRLRTVTEPLHPSNQSDPCLRATGSRSFELVTDPQTLLPDLTRSVREDEINSCGEDGTVHTRKMSQGEQFVFIYGLKPVPEGTYSSR